MKKLKLITTLVLLLSIVMASVSQASILTSVGQLAGTDSITSDKFRTLEDLDSNALYGSFYHIVVDVNKDGVYNDEPGSGNERWGDRVFLRNEYKAYPQKVIHSAFWAVGQSTPKSVDVNESSMWLGSKYRINWNSGSTSEIIPTATDQDIIVEKIYSESTGLEFHNVTKQQLLDHEYSYNIIMESAVLISLPVGYSYGGITYTAADAVWFTYRQFRDYADRLEAACNGNSDKLSSLKLKLAPLFYLFSVKYTIGTEKHNGNMSKTLYTESLISNKFIYEGYGNYHIEGNVDTAQSVYIIHALRVAGQDKLKAIGSVWKNYKEGTTRKLTRQDPSILTTAIKFEDSLKYGFKMNNPDTVAVKGYVRYFNSSLLDDQRSIYTNTNRYKQSVILGVQEVTLNAILEKTQKPAALNVYPIEPGVVNIPDNTSFQAASYNADALGYAAGVGWSLPEPVDSVVLTYDAGTKYKYDKYVVYIYDGEFVDSLPEICVSELSPLTSNPTPGINYVATPTTAAITAKVTEKIQVEEMRSDEKLSDFLDMDKVTNADLSAIKVTAIGYDSESLEPVTGGDYEVGTSGGAQSATTVIKTWNETLTIAQAFDMTITELIDPIKTKKFKKIFVVYDNNLDGTVQAQGSMKANELTKVLTTQLNSVTGSVSLPGTTYCPTILHDYWETDEIDWKGVPYKQGHDSYYAHDLSQPYSWTGSLTESYNPLSVFSNVGSKVVKVAGVYSFNAGGTTSATGNSQTLDIGSLPITYLTQRKAGTADGNLYIAPFMGSLNNSTAKTFLKNNLSFTEGVTASAWATGATAGLFSIPLTIPNLTGGRDWNHDMCNTHSGDYGGQTPVNTASSFAERTSTTDMSVTPFYIGKTINAAGDVAKTVESAQYYRLEKTGTPIPYVPAIKCITAFDLAGTVGDVWITGKTQRSFKPVDVFEMSMVESANGSALYSAPWSRDAKDTATGVSTLKAGTLYKTEGNPAGSITVTINSYIHVPIGTSVTNGDSIVTAKTNEHKQFVDSVINGLELESYSTVPYNYQANQLLKNSKIVQGMPYASAPAKYKGQTIAVNGCTVSEGATASTQFPVLSEYYSAYGGSGTSLESSTIKLLNNDNLITVNGSVARLNASIDKTNYGGYYVEHFPAMMVIKQTTVLTVKIKSTATTTYFIHPKLSDSLDTASGVLNTYGPTASIGSIPVKKFGVGLALNFKSLSGNDYTSDYTWYNVPKTFNIRGTVNDSK